jgi:putative ABC transport system permease protein
MRNDLVVILRGLARTPLTALLAMAALCVGVAVTISIYTVVRGVLLRGLPYPEGDRLVLVWRGSARDTLDRGALSPPDFQDVAARAASFSSVGAVNSFSTTYVPEAGDAEQVVLGVVAGDFFATLRARPLLGRVLDSGDDRPLNTRDPNTVSTIVLEHAFWTRAFGADPGVLGRTIEMGGSRMRIVGVMPPSFHLHMPAGAGMSTDLVGWTPLGINYATAPRDGAYLKVIARLAPGFTPDQAQAELAGIAGDLRRSIREHQEAGMVLRVARLEDEVRAHIRPILLLLAAAGLLLLLVACGNAAALLLVRFTARGQELAVRRALGAGEGRLLRPLLTESALLALGGAAAGLLLAGPAIRMLLALEPGIVPRTASLEIDGALVAAALGLALLLALLCGLGPALLATRGELHGVLRTQRASMTRGAQRLRRSTVLLQAAVCFVLLYSSASLLGTLLRLQRADLGVANGDVLTARVSLPFARYRGPDYWIPFYQEFTSRLAAQPGVRAVALSSDLPTRGDLTLEPYAPVEFAETTNWGQHTSLYRIVGPGYFNSMGIALHAGREFIAADRDGAPDVIIIDETLARALTDLAPGPVIGRRLRVTVHEFAAGYRVAQRTAEIVGVVGTVAHEHPDARPPGTIYMSHAQYPLWSMYVAVRGAAGAPGPALIRSVLDDMDRNLPLSDVSSLRGVVDRILAPTRFVLALIGTLSIAVIVLTVAGLFGIVADSVRQRRRELALRMAIGASPASVARLVLRGGLVLSVLGMVPGALLAPGASRMLERGISSGGFAPAAFVAAASALLAVAAVACFLPAWRAGRVDPMATLREE